MEIWEPVRGFSGYEVSDQGRVKNATTGKVLRPRKAGHGYLSVCLGAGNYRYIHRLVACEFCENPFCLPQVNHLDGVKTNNSSTNLAWVSRNENMRHAFEAGLLANTACCNPKSGEDHARSQAILMIADGGMLQVKFESIRQASKQTGIDYSTIHGAVNGKFSSAGGAIWKKETEVNHGNH